MVFRLPGSGPDETLEYPADRRLDPENRNLEYATIPDFATERANRPPRKLHHHVDVTKLISTTGVAFDLNQMDNFLIPTPPVRPGATG